MSQTHSVAHEQHAVGVDRSSGSVLGAAAAAIAVSVLSMWGGLAERTSALAALADRNEAAWALAASGDGQVVEALGGPLAYVTFKRARRAQAWRLNPDSRPSTAPSAIQGYATQGGPVAVNAESVAALAELLESPHATRASNKRCGFSPGVAVRWQDGSHTLDVLLCFTCNDLQYYFDDELVDHPYDFMRVRPALVAWVKRQFPKDPQLQALAEQR